MATLAKKASTGMKDHVDRISDLPEFILHHILSFLGTKEACRVSVLSKKWASVWGTIPFLNFQIDYFVKRKLGCNENSRKFDQEYYDKDSVDRFVSFIDCVMQRYSKERLCIKKFSLEFPMLDPSMAPIIDKWINMLVLSNIEELRLTFFLKDYTLPEVLFSARSLRLLSCSGVKLPNYSVINLTALRKLSFEHIHADEDMLQKIISFCPLIALKINSCTGVDNISIPSSSKIENLRLSRVINESGVINLETAGSLQNFSYHGIEKTWPCKMNAVALKNLRNLYLYCAAITDGSFLNIISELNLLECLGFHSCIMPSSIHILSGCLKELVLDGCGNLENAVFDTPNLMSFCYIGEKDTSLSFTNIHPECATYLHVMTDCVTSSWFAKLKKFLMRSKNCKLFNILLMSNVSMRNFSAHKLGNSGSPFEVRELKLSLTEQWTPTESSLTAVVEGLFWSCRPELLSISTSLDFENKFVKMFVEVLKKKVKCWEEPLKDFEVVSADCTGLMAKYEEDDSDDLDIQFRLHWSS